MTCSDSVLRQLNNIATTLLRYDSFVIAGHLNPDTDCVSSQLALMHALHRLGKTATCVLAQDVPLGAPCAFLPGAQSMIAAERYEKDFEVLIAVDVPSRKRMGEAACALLDRCRMSVRIDHHRAEEPLCCLECCEVASASASLLIWHLCECLGVDRGGDIAQCCYAGVAGDTGGFRFQNTDAESLRLAADMLEQGADPSLTSRYLFNSRTRASLSLESLALQRMRLGADGAYAVSWLTERDFIREQAARTDSEGIINALRSLEDVRVVVLLREQDGIIRGSIRSKDDYDVSLHARNWNGGGHKAAAGFTFEGSLFDAMRCVDGDLAASMGLSQDRVAFQESDYREVLSLQSGKEKQKIHSKKKTDLSVDALEGKVSR